MIYTKNQAVNKKREISIGCPGIPNSWTRNIRRVGLFKICTKSPFPWLLRPREHFPSQRFSAITWRWALYLCTELAVPWESSACTCRPLCQVRCCGSVIAACTCRPRCQVRCCGSVLSSLLLLMTSLRPPSPLCILSQTWEFLYFSDAQVKRRHWISSWGLLLNVWLAKYYSFIYFINIFPVFLFFFQYSMWEGSR